MQDFIAEISMTTHLIGRRIQAIRKKRGLSQQHLAELFGLNDRQTVSAMENGARRITADELILAVEKLDMPLEYFTDPFLLAGEGRFSWRHDGVDANQLEDFELSVSRWIAAYRELAPRVGREMPLMRRMLSITRQSSFEDAIQAGERFADEFNLGCVPAKRLGHVMERKLGILVLMINAHQGIYGAACRLHELDTVLIARHEIAGRRNFNLAHELFHLLTWNAMPPEHLEEATETGGSRVEQLANNFAAALLMPANTLAKFGDWSANEHNFLIEHLNTTADKLHVTALALKWRLVSIGALSQEIAHSVPDAALWNNGHDIAQVETPVLFSQPFAEVIGLAVGAGYISVRRVATLLDLTIEEIQGLFKLHNVMQPVEP